MKSLVLELQKAAEDEKIKVSALLRKAKVVAAKLKRTDINEWIQKEIHGYKESKSIPEYRSISAEIIIFYSWDVRGRLIDLDDKEFENQLSLKSILDSVIVIESLIEQMQKNNMPYIEIPIPSSFFKPLKIRNKTFSNDDRQVFRISVQQYSEILESVRNKILDWSLDLEAQGITGKDMTFSTEDVGKATKVTFNINNSNVTGIGGVNAPITTTEGHSNSTTIEAGDHSTILSNVDIKDYSQIYLELKGKGVPDDAVKELKEAINLLQQGNAKDKEGALKKGKAFIKKYGPAIGKGALAILIKSIFAG